MISAKLIKSLEEEGFTLNFPRYESNEERIIELIREGNERLLLALPLLLQYEFAYEKIIKNLNTNEIKILNKIILITRSIFQDEGIEHKHTTKIIKQYHLSAQLFTNERAYYTTAFRDALQKKEKREEKDFTTQIDMRTRLNLNKALLIIYSPGKRRIMEKIFNHEALTNTELKYYYRAIRPFIAAILNENLQKYLRIINSMKKYTTH